MWDSMSDDKLKEFNEMMNRRKRICIYCGALFDYDPKEYGPGSKYCSSDCWQFDNTSDDSRRDET